MAADEPVGSDSLESKDDVFTITVTDRDGSLTMVGDALWIIDARGRHVDTVSEHRLAALREATQSNDSALLRVVMAAMVQAFDPELALPDRVQRQMQQQKVLELAREAIDAGF